MNPEAHRFLLAMPSLAGSYFGDTLIYLFEHNDEGSAGLVVNRPTDMTLGGLAKQLNISPAPSLVDTTILDGGPVGTEQGFVLHSEDGQFESTRQIAPGVQLSTTADAIRAISTLEGPLRAQVFLGYAGWGPGQLEGELEDDAWLVCPASREVLFEVPYQRRAQEAAKRLGFDLRLLAHKTGHA